MIHFPKDSSYGILLLRVSHFGKYWNFKFETKMFLQLTSSNGHPVERNTEWDCKINSFRSLSFISANCVGFVRIIVIFNVTFEVNSPRISLTEIRVLSVILSSGRGFQFLIMIAPVKNQSLDRTLKTMWLTNLWRCSRCPMSNRVSKVRLSRYHKTESRPEQSRSCPSRCLAGDAKDCECPAGTKPAARALTPRHNEAARI